MKITKIVARVLLAALAYVVGVVLMGMLSPSLHLPQLKAIAGVSQQQAFLGMLLAAPMLALALLPLAFGLKGPWLRRCLAVGALFYVALGLNTLLETKIFTGLLDGSPWAASLFWVLPALLTAAVLTFRTDLNDKFQKPLGNFGVAGWGWRLFTAWLAFPPIYFIFGMFVAPFVVPYYQQSGGVLGLRIPSFEVIIRMQLLRSALFLAASLPAILLWNWSRTRLILALGLAHAMMVGIFQLSQATFLPMTLRIGHSLEITGDSFAYAAVLALLFTQSRKAIQPATKGSAAAAD